MSCTSCFWKAVAVCTGLFTPLAPVKADEPSALDQKVEELTASLIRQVQDYAASGQVERLAPKLSMMLAMDRHCELPKTLFHLVQPQITLQDLEDFNKFTDCSPEYETTILVEENQFDDFILDHPQSCEISKEDEAELEEFAEQVWAEMMLFNSARSALKTLIETAQGSGGDYSWECPPQ
jgi:hypothetical protein